MATLALSFRIDAQTAAALQQIQAFQRQLAAVGGVKLQDPTSALKSGLSGTAGEVLGLVAKMASLAAIAGTVAAAFKAGLNVNAETESAVLGIKSLVAALTTVKDSSGTVVKDLGKRIAISGTIAEDQVKKLRIAGLETAATFQQLLGAFQQGIGAGSSAGLSLDKIRELTIGITQAAGALGMPMNQLNQEVRSLLSGDISADSTVAKALGINKKQVDAWRESGKLADELNKRLEVFKRLGPEAGATWSATLSNMQDAVSMLLGEMSKGAFDNLKQSLQGTLSQIFDINTVGIADPFKGLADVGTAAFTAIGVVLTDALAGGVDLAKQLSAWFVKHEDEVLVIGNAFSVVYDNVKGVLSSIVSAIGAVASLSVESGNVYGVFGSIAIIVALIQDGFQLWKGVLADVGGYILDKVGGPLRTVLGGLRDFLAAIPGIGTGLASAVDSLIKSIPASGDGLHAVAKGIQADFDAGRTAVARTNAELSKTGQELREQAAERKREANRGAKAAPTGTSLGKKVNDPDKAKKAAEAYAAALRAYAEAETAAAKKVAQAQRDIAEAALDKSLQDRLVSQKDYLTKKADLEKQALADEIAAAKKQAALLSSDMAGEKDPAKKKKFEGDLLKVKAEITALEAKGVVIDTKLKINLEEFQRQIESLRVDITANILDLKGQPFEAGLARLKKETDDLLNDPRVRDDAALKAAVSTQAAMKEQRLQFDEAKRLSDERIQILSMAEERINMQVEQGKMTAVEAERAIRAERLLTADSILKQVQALETLAAANPGNMSLALDAQKARIEFEKLNTTLDATATSINHDLAGAGPAFLTSLSQGESVIRSIGSALSDVFGSLAKRVLKQFEDSLFEALQGSSGQGAGGMLSQFIGGKGIDFGKLWGAGTSALSSLGSFLGFSEGGFTGSGRKMQAAGIVHKGEYVFTQAEVRKMGLPFFHGLKSNIRGGHRLPGYSEGGLVGGGMAGVAERSFSPTIQGGDMHLSPNLYLDMNDLASKLGRNAQFGRDVAKVVFVDNESKMRR